MTDSTVERITLEGRYKIQERLGTGGMARVYKAYDTNLERLVAIKILHDHLAADSTFKERFTREAKFVAGFNHPHIVQIYDFNIIESATDPLYYMVMPYLPGPTLKQILENYVEQGEHMPQKKVFKIITDICDALSYAHNRGMIHRDVKPANILFNEHNSAILTDFGIARLAEGSNLTQEGVATGTPVYMSPEQVSGKQVDARSDIYALGIILYEMLAGTPPFNSDSGISTMLQHIHEPVPSLSSVVSSIDPVLESGIIRALAKDPDDRFSTVTEFNNYLQGVLPVSGTDSAPFIEIQPAASKKFFDGEETRILDAQPSPTHTLQQKIKRNTSPWGILASGVSIIAIIAIIALFNNRPRTEVEETVPSMTAETSDVSSYFEPEEAANMYWPTGASGTITREITNDGYYRFSNERQGIAATTLLEYGQVYEDTIITVEGLLDESSQRSSAYGIVFRYADADNYYVFAVDGARRYSIWIREDGVWHELRDEDEAWTFDEVIQPIGNTNILRIEADDDHFIGTVNGTIVADVHDDRFASGQVGLYLATPNTGSATTLIDSYLLETDLSGAPSMTADEEPSS